MASIIPMSGGYNYPYPFTRFDVLNTLYGSNRVPPFPYTTIGKLFFTLGGNNYVCSASVSRPHLLITARHCIYDYATGTWATNVIFYPDYYNGVANPYTKVWYARVMATWVSGAPGMKYDMGYIQTWNLTQTGCATNNVENYTGFLGYMYGGSVRARAYNMFGYPQAAPFTGNKMVESQSWVGDEDSSEVGGPGFEPDTFSAGNDMTGGSSGGPWIVTFVPGAAGANNFVNGLNSFKWVVPARPLEMNGPRFNADNFKALLDFAVAIPCP